MRGVTIEGSAGSLLQVTNSDGTLDGVTLGVNTTLREGAQVTVLNGLTLANGVTNRACRWMICALTDADPNAGFRMRSINSEVLMYL